LITDEGLTIAAKSINITYIALGDGTTAPSASDTTLVSEKFRKAVTQHIDNGTGDEQTICYIAPYEANDFEIQEVGAFTGDATDAVNSGTLVARWLYQRQKTDLE